MNLLKTSCLTATFALAASLLMPAHAAGRGGWDANGTSINGLASGASQVATGQPARVESIELPAHAASRGGWDGNGPSISGLASAASQVATGQPARVQSIELPSSAAQGATAK